MPQVVMLVSMAAANWSLVPGEVIEVNEETAGAWEENGIAKLYVQPEIKVIKHNTDPVELDISKDDEINQSINLNKPPEEILNEGSPDDETGVELEHLGGGWYLLPNGEKVHGKADATQALKELQGSDV